MNHQFNKFMKINALALPLSLLPLCLAATPARAATPMATIGVTATVLTGCKVSTAVVNGSYAAALEHAASSVTVSCTDNTQYSISVIADTAVKSSVAIGKLSFPLQSLVNYAMSSPSAHSYRHSGFTGDTVANGGSYSSKPLVSFAESSALASGAPPDTISVAITY
jgi:spore coat protein U-like protein